MLFMPLPLRQLGVDEVIGIYPDKLPARMRYLAPGAGASFIADLSEFVVVSDMLRSPESSLNARRKGRGGVQRPAYSGHNYGKSIDLDVRKTLASIGLRSKRQLDEWMEARGWYCHRRDHKRKSEEWHYNYFGSDFSTYVRDSDTRTSAGLERMLVAEFGKWWTKMSNEDAQRALTRLGMYDGDIDGKFGPISREATRVFQRGWIPGKPVTGRLNTMTKRTLAFVTADRVLQ